MIVDLFPLDSRAECSFLISLIPAQMFFFIFNYFYQSYGSVVEGYFHSYSYKLYLFVRQLNVDSWDYSYSLMQGWGAEEGDAVRICVWVCFCVCVSFYFPLFFPCVYYKFSSDLWVRVKNSGMAGCMFLWDILLTDCTSFCLSMCFCFY